MKRNREFFSEFITGAFMVAVFALLAYFTVVISGFDVFGGRRSVDVRIAFDDVGGLKERDSVMYRGTRVGTVKTIELGDKGITLIANISRDVRLRENCRISVASLSLLGGNYLLLEEGDGAELPLEGVEFRGVPPVDWMRDLAEVAKALRELTAADGLKGIVSNLEHMVASADTVVSRVERGEGFLGQLMAPGDTLYADLKETAGSLKKTVASAETVAARIEKGEGMVGKLLSSDEKMYEDLKAAVSEVRAVAEKISQGEGLLGRLAGDKDMGDNASKLLANLEKVSDNLAAGRGTIGRLASDEEMYNELQGLLKDVRQIIDNYRDTTPITTFGSLIMGGL